MRDHLINCHTSAGTALSPGTITQQAEIQSWVGTYSKQLGFSLPKSKLRASRPLQPSNPKDRGFCVEKSIGIHVSPSISFALEESCQSTMRIQISQKMKTLRWHFSSHLLHRDFYKFMWIRMTNSKTVAGRNDD